MSSYKSKGKSKGSSQRAEWSQWIWDERSYQYYRTQLQQDGEYAYEYRPADTAATPRSEASQSTAAPYVSSSSANAATVDSQYYQNRDYELSGGSSSINALADKFSSQATISSPSISSASYTDSTASSNDYRWGPSGSSAADGRSFPASSGSYGIPSSGEYNQGAQSQYPSAGFGAASSSSFYNSSAPSLQQPPNSGEQGSSGALTPTDHIQISGTAGAPIGESETLDSRFQVQRSSSFQIGQVFKILWSEPQGVNASSNNTDVTRFTIGEKYGQKVYQSIRRFVVVATGHGHSQCIPITTYQHKGGQKPGINKHDHAFVYMGDHPPKRFPQHAAGLVNDPVQIKSNSPRDKLHIDSCINFAKIYNVEHNVKVLFIGRLSKSSEKRVLLAVNQAWNRNTNSSPNTTE